MIEADVEDQQDSRIWSGKSLALTQSSSSSMLRHKGAPESSKIEAGELPQLSGPGTVPWSVAKCANTAVIPSMQVSFSRISTLSPSTYSMII